MWVCHPNSTTPVIRLGGVFVLFPSELTENVLDLCWASAKSVFGEQATPEVAIAILDKVMAKIAMDRQAEALRHRIEDDYDDDYSDEF